MLPNRGRGSALLLGTVAFAGQIPLFFLAPFGGVWVDRWNKRPRPVMFLAATVGLPPVYLLGFIAWPLMRMRFWTFTAICFVGRIGRYAVMAGVPMLWQ